MKTLHTFSLLTLVCIAPQIARAATSELWGEQGEKWSATSRLPDFSRAGYHQGETPPQLPATVSVTQFGAKGDGVTDDTAAFVKAIASTEKGVISLPAGRFVLTDVVKIEKSNIVLRGAGRDKTVLVIPKSLSQIQGVKMSADNKSKYSFSGGFLEVAGRINGDKLADVSADALRGARQLTVSDAQKIAPHSWVRLTMRDSDHSLGRALHNQESDAGVDTYNSLKGKNWIDWAAQVLAVHNNVITLDRPLRLPVRAAWQPEIRAFVPTVSEVGIEDLSFEFPGVPKKAHLKEEGFNAITLQSAVNCWVRNVSFTDADIGVIVGNSKFCTVENTHFVAVKRTGETGHHALWATGGTQDCLFSDFDFQTTYVHDLTVEGRANGNVFHDGRGVALNFDHHRNAPYENLFSNLDVGNARRVWASSGRSDRGPHSGVRATFWNLRAEKGKFAPPKDWPQINLIGVPDTTRDTTENQQWIEPLNAPVEPADLYRAQRESRLE